MRRFVLSLAVVLSAAALSACSGGGSVLGFGGDNPSPDHVIITVAAPSNIARVVPGAGLALSATQVHGSQNGLLSGNDYRWSAALVTAGSTTYIANTLGQTKPCGGVTLGPGSVPYTADFTTITPSYPYCVVVNAQPGKITGSGLGTTFTPTGPPGSITVAVVNPQNPLQ